MAVELALERFRDIAPRFLGSFKPNSCIEVTRFMKEIFACLGIEVEAVSTKLSVHCRAKNVQYICGVDEEERAAGMKAAANWVDREPWKTGFNGHVVGIVAKRFWVDCTLSQASCPDHGFVIEPDVLIVPLPEKLPAIENLELKARVVIGEFEAEVRWWGLGDRSFEVTEAWEPSHLVKPARIVADEISATLPAHP